MAVEIDEEGFSVETDDLDSLAEYEVVIKVFGVGGGGCNALEYIAKQHKKDFEEAKAKAEKDGTYFDEKDRTIHFVATNTDVPALKRKDKTLMHRIQLGPKCAKGRGAGGKPEVAAQAAVESKQVLEQELKDTAILFIAAGMGGGTGTGAAPVIAQLAREMGILTVGVVTKPFDFEREQKMNQAMKGIDEMRKHVDALLIVPNQRLIDKCDSSLTIEQSFDMSNEVLYKAVKIVSDMVTGVSNINTDFADLSTVLENAGDAHIALGVGSGEKRIDEAIEQIVNSPLLETSINNATRLLITVTLSPKDASLTELDEATKRITSVAAPNAIIIPGICYDESLQDKMVITVIATSFIKEPVAEVPTRKVQARQEHIPASRERYNDDLADEIITTSTAKSLGGYVHQTLAQEDFDTDSLDRLETIFNSRK